MSVINIAGLLIHTLPTKTKTVANELKNEPGVEIHNILDDGRLVVIVEKDTQKETEYTMNRFQSMDHVICISLVYQYFDNDVTEKGLLL